MSMNILNDISQVYMEKVASKPDFLDLDKDGNKVVGFEMSDLDKVGLTKFDVLGINLLDKIMEICDEGE